MLKLKERKLKKALEKLSLERLIFDAPMAEYTSFKCGGRAYCLAEPSDEADIKALIDIAAVSEDQVFFSERLCNINKSFYIGLI